jgi:hypothetical protein
LVVETQNADIALEHAQDKLIRAFEEAARNCAIEVPHG